MGSVLKKGELSIMDIKVMEMPDFHVAYVRRMGPYGPEIGKTFEKLMAWAWPKVLLGPETRVFGVYWDNPEVTPPEKCRSDAAITVPEGTDVEGEVGLEVLPVGLFAVYHTNVYNDNFEIPWSEAWKWVQEKGYELDSAKPCYEVYYNDAAQDPEHKWIVDICLRVKPL